MMKFLFIAIFGILVNHVHSIEQTSVKAPLILNHYASPVLNLKGEFSKQLVFNLEGTTDISDVEALFLVEGHHDVYKENLKKLAETYNIGLLSTLEFDELQTEDVTVFAKVRPKANLKHTVAINLKGQAIQSTYQHRFGMALSDDLEVKGARIPGIVTTPKGTLLVTYDARYESSQDLQGHIDIVLKRSVDGGQTWEPMKKIIDMGTWGGLPEKYNGVSDACILVDNKTGKIFVAGLWMHGVKDKTGQWLGAVGWNHQWRAGGSMSGYSPKETSQFMMVESEDDGLTWSEPKNLTRSLKQESWRLFAPAPGRGICMKNGILVMPTQGILEDNTTFSNFIYSKDGGITWTVSNPAHTNTTESQIVELKDGSLMLNMRDNRNRKATDLSMAGRAVFTTKDMGTSWSKHPTSGLALPEPVCCAGLWSHDSKNMLIFSNPPNLHNQGGRTRMTLKFSFDDGMTWPQDQFMMINESKSMYSCLTSIDDNTIGIVYECLQANICFQKIAIDDLNTLAQ